MSNPYIIHKDILDDDGKEEKLVFHFRRLTVGEALHTHRLLADMKGKTEDKALVNVMEVLDILLTNWEGDKVPYEICMEVVLMHPSFRSRSGMRETEKSGTDSG